MKAPASIARPALRYRGGKWRIAPWIVAHLPPHESYVEPFAGGASVLMHKPPARFETLNDLDGAVVTFWRVLREQTDALLHAIELTPWSREEFRLAREPTSDPLERARRFYVSCWQSYGKTHGRGGWRFQVSSNGWGVHRPQSFKQIAHLEAIAARLACVQLECRPALEILRLWDRPGVLFYCDPPYLPDTRPGSRRLYPHEMGEPEHRELAEVLQGLKARVVLSGYPHPLYAELFAGWRCERLETWAEAQKRAVECLWMNPAADLALRAAGRQLGLFEELRP